MDPCLFKFTRSILTPDGKLTSTSEFIALIHTDDVGMIGSDDGIMQDVYDAMDKEWGVNEVKSDHVLGGSARF